MKKIIFEVKKKMDVTLMSEEDVFLDEYDEAIARLYDETYEFLSNVETVMHIIPEKKGATKEKLVEIERMIDKTKQYNKNFMNMFSKSL